MKTILLLILSAGGFLGVFTQGFLGAPAQGYLGAPAQGYLGAPAQGYLGAPAQGYLGIFTASAYAQQATPACESAQHSEFSFWVGEWTVATADGKHAGDSKITLIQDGCVLQENWRSAQSDYTGTSYNAFNQVTKQWEQLWLDNKGGRLHLKGQREGKQMILRSEPKPDKDGNNSYNQITWTANDDGSVRQYWEVFTVGKPTSVSFDGLYTAVE